MVNPIPEGIHTLTPHLTIRNAAAAIGRAHELGSLEVGKQADLLVLSVPDYRHLGYRFGPNLVEAVIKKGKRVL